jgi:hypothetical protein
MHQVPQSVWRRIAQTQELRTAWARYFFPLVQHDMYRIIDQVGENLEKAGYPAKVITSYLTVLPLLVEHSAIQRFVVDNGSYSAALPEVLSKQEAVILMSRDKMLSPDEEQSLMELLPDDETGLPLIWAEPMWDMLSPW